jgi:hypothetical protein
MAALSVSTTPSSVRSAGTVHCGLMARRLAQLLAAAQVDLHGVVGHALFGQQDARAARAGRGGAVVEVIMVQPSKLQLVLRAGVKVAGVVALVQLAGRVAPCG